MEFFLLEQKELDKLQSSHIKSRALNVAVRSLLFSLECFCCSPDLEIGAKAEFQSRDVCQRNDDDDE